MAFDGNTSSLENLEDIYQLSPMQQGMLFHTIYTPESGAYFEQTLFTIAGELDVEMFERAWQQVVDRHSILRSSFLWEELERPQQVVHRRVRAPFEKLDWSDLPASVQEQRLANYIASDRANGFDLATPPLMRLALFRFSDQLHRFVFSRHHLLIDRWSRSLLLKEVAAFYEALRKGAEPTLPPLRPYGDYIAWLDKQDQAAAEKFWRSSLAGFAAPTTLGIDKRISAGGAKDPTYGD